MSSPGRPRQNADERRRNAAFVLPAFGVFLLLPPFVNLFIRDRLVFGLPLEVVYLFGVWLALVIGARVLSRRVAEAAAEEPPAENGSGENGPA